MSISQEIIEVPWASDGQYLVARSIHAFSIAMLVHDGAAIQVYLAQRGLMTNDPVKIVVGSKYALAKAKRL